MRFWLAVVLVMVATAAPLHGQGSFGTGAANPVDTTPPQPKGPRARSVSIVLPVSKDRAIDLVTSVLIDSGYQIDETGPSLIKTVPLARYGNTLGFVMRANVIGFVTGDSTRVVLSGTFFNYMVAAMARSLSMHDPKQGEDQPVEKYGWGVQSKLWARLTNAGAAIATAGGGHVAGT